MSARRNHSLGCIVLVVSGALVVAAAGRVHAQRRQTVIAIELEDVVNTVRPSAGTVARQDMQGFGGGWSGAQLFWAAAPPVDRPIRNWPHLSFSIDIPSEGGYEVVLRHTAAPDFGTFRVFLDGEPVGDVDGYSPVVAPRSQNFGRRQLARGAHQVTVTVFGKARGSTNFFVGLDRFELRALETTDVLRDRRTPDVTTGRRAPDVIPDRAARQPADPKKASPEKGASAVSIDPALLSRALCLSSPETCCPEGKYSTDGCRMVTEALLDIRIRSYVPPRFTTMGLHDPWDTNVHHANIVSDVNVSGPYKVWPGCRFNVREATHAIEDSKNILQKAGELFEAWLAQWSGGVEAAKTWVSKGIADEVCGVVDNSESCRTKLASLVKTGINVGIAALGIPPEIPDVQQLRQHGIRYLAGQAASYALGDPGLLEKLPVDEAARIAIYKTAYDKGLDVLTKELNKVVPSPSFSSENPATWGHLEPAYAPHNAHLYIEVRVKPQAYAKYLHLLAVKPTHKWQPVYLHDGSQIYASSGAIAVPAFIPPEGVILPIELKPFDEPSSKADTAFTQIPGVKISNAWLKEKFGIKAADGLVKAQRNWLPRIHATYYYSDWDLFYEAYGKSRFRLLMAIGKGVLDLEKDWEAAVGTVRDADIDSKAILVLTNTQQLQNYYGRIDPAPRCDGKPNVVAFKE